MFNRLETAKQQRQITAETSILFRNYLQNEVIQSLTNQLVDYRLETHQVMPYSGLLPEELQPLWENMLKHLSLLNMHRDNNIKLSQQLESIAMQSKIEDFNKLFSEHLAFLDEHREQQQTWLGIYVLAGLLLISVLIYALRHYHEQHYFHKTESMTDTLTGLGNRRLLEQQLPVLFNEAKRNHTSLGILFIDLDGFKAVNDTLGHQQGMSCCVISPMSCNCPCGRMIWLSVLVAMNLYWPSPMPIRTFSSGLQRTLCACAARHWNRTSGSVPASVSATILQIPATCMSW